MDVKLSEVLLDLYKYIRPLLMYLEPDHITVPDSRASEQGRTQQKAGELSQMA